jgi:hypothetical protein
MYAAIAVRMMASGLSFMFVFMYASSFFFFSVFVGDIESVSSSSSCTILELPRFTPFLVTQFFGSDIINVDLPVTCIFFVPHLIF